MLIPPKPNGIIFVTPQEVKQLMIIADQCYKGGDPPAFDEEKWEALITSVIGKPLKGTYITQIVKRIRVRYSLFSDSKNN